MSKVRRNYQRVLASLIVFFMIFTLLPFNSWAEGETGVNIWIRLEGDDQSLVAYRELQVQAQDISYVDGLEDLQADKPLLIHAIVQALEAIGLDTKDPDVFSAAGGFIGGIDKYSSQSGGWMYLINGDMSDSGVTEYELQEDDIIDMYYVSDWSNYSMGKLTIEDKDLTINEETSLTFTAKKEEWGVDHEYEPVEGGIIRIGDKEFTTDENGQVKVSFQEAGSYTILADKQLEAGNIVRPRPLILEVKEKEEEKGEEKDLDLEKTLAATIDWLVANDEVNEWVLMELARGNRGLDQEGLKEFRKALVDSGGDFRLVTDYAKYSIIGSALGLNAEDIFGHNLIEKIYNDEDIFSQGNNGGVFALLALDSKNYQVPEDAKWTREAIVARLIEGQNEDGGFSWVKDWDSDGDMTAMVLQALSNHLDQDGVEESIGKALDYLSDKQDQDGGYSNEWDGVVSESSETVAQVIIALTSLDIDPLEDERFIKDNNLLDKLLDFQLEDGAFEHNTGDGASAISTEQALRALVAYERFVNDELKLFNMEDARPVEFPQEEKPELDYKDLDQASDWAKESISKAGELGLMQGKGKNQFDPKGNLTRAEFATLMVNLLKLESDKEFNQAFTDVKPQAWYYDAVMTVYEQGIVKGKGEGIFDPESSISREEMAVMIARALDMASEEDHQIADLDQASDWALDAISLVYELDIMKGSSDKFDPKGLVSREMAATIIVRVYELD